MLKREEIGIRDPYILAVNGEYYMYSSSFEHKQLQGCDEKCLYMVVYKSTDLEEWTEPKVVFKYMPTEESEIQKDLWAPEVHMYNEKFYAFMSFQSKRGTRGTYVAVADTPDSIFVLLEDKPVTPVGQSAIDGTLFIENGTPFVVYSRDWPFNYIEEKNAYVGEIWAKKLNYDLTGSNEREFRLFSSDEVPLSKETPHRIFYEGKNTMRYGSDAPFLMMLSDGKLFLTWSPYLNNNYVVLSAISESGKLKGPWKHSDKPLFDNNGGHAMFFKDYDESLKMCIHQPELEGKERLMCLEVEEKDGTIKLKL